MLFCEALLISIQNICIYEEIRKLFLQISLLWGPMPSTLKQQKYLSFINVCVFLCCHGHIKQSSHVYILNFQLEAIQDRFRNTIGDISNELKLLKQHSVMLMEQLQIIEEKHPTIM